MKRIPDIATISISGHEYKFERVRKISIDGDENYDGLYRAREHTIFVRADMGERQDAFVTLHEITHAILQHAGLHNIVTDEQGEALADALAYGLLSVRVNGKALLR